MGIGCRPRVVPVTFPKASIPSSRKLRSFNSLIKSLLGLSDPEEVFIDEVDQELLGGEKGRDSCWKTPDFESTFADIRHLFPEQYKKISNIFVASALKNLPLISSLALGASCRMPKQSQQAEGMGRQKDGSLH